MNGKELKPREVIAFTLWGEARGEPEEGIIAVASVIYNRTRAYLKHHEDVWPAEAMKEVCLAHKQFSCWNSTVLPSNPNDLYIEFNQEGPIAENPKWIFCYDLAGKMVNGTFEITNDAVQYYASYCKPYWVSSFTVVCQIGKHIFMK